MSNFSDKIDDLKNMEYVDFNIENFYSPANNERYNKFLIQYVFRYYTNLKKINKYYIEKKLNGENNYAGIFRNNNALSCVIPTRQTLYDEMVCIHELTHLISELKGNISNNSAFSEIIPYFNEYEYLMQINEFFAKQYEIYRLNTAINAAKNLSDKNKLKAYSYINAFYTLETRKNDYDIKKLNKINSKSKDIKNSLKEKGYTI